MKEFCGFTKQRPGKSEFVNVCGESKIQFVTNYLTWQSLKTLRLTVNASCLTNSPLPIHQGGELSDGSIFIR